MAASPNQLPATTNRSSTRPAVITVGDGPRFHAIREWLETAVPAPGLQHFNSLEHTLQTLNSDSHLPELAIIFRSWCDEHPQTLVQQFIGRFFFRRIICCEGPLCVSEARTHQFWPVSCRTSLAAAPAQIALHLNQLQTGRPGLSPLAAPEDLFASQATTATPATQALPLLPDSVPARHTYVFAADAVLRQTLIELLRNFGIHAEIMDAAALRQFIQNPSAVPARLIIDADERHEQETSLQQLKHRGFCLIALTGFPGVALPDWATQRLDKTELLLQLPTLLRADSSDRR